METSVHWQLGQIENGIVAVTAYGVVDSIAIPLLFGLQTRIADLAKGYLSQQALYCRNHAGTQSNRLSIQGACWLIALW